MLFDIQAEAFPIILSKRKITNSLFVSITDRKKYYLGYKEFNYAYGLEEKVLKDINSFIELLFELSKEQILIYLDVYSEQDDFTNQFIDYRNEIKIVEKNDFHHIKYKLEYKSYDFDSCYILDTNESKTN